jgi:hypothetical protein
LGSLTSKSKISVSILWDARANRTVRRTTWSGIRIVVLRECLQSQKKRRKCKTRGETRKEWIGVNKVDTSSLSWRRHDDNPSERIRVRRSDTSFIQSFTYRCLSSSCSWGTEEPKAKKLIQFDITTCCELPTMFLQFFSQVLISLTWCPQRVNHKDISRERQILVEIPGYHSEINFFFAWARSISSNRWRLENMFGEKIKCRDLCQLLFILFYRYVNSCLLFRKLFKIFSKTWKTRCYQFLTGSKVFVIGKILFQFLSGKKFRFYCFTTACCLKKEIIFEMLVKPPSFV